jgi:hypothetical protein
VYPIRGLCKAFLDERSEAQSPTFRDRLGELFLRNCHGRTGGFIVSRAEPTFGFVFCRPEKFREQQRLKLLRRLVYLSRTILHGRAGIERRGRASGRE